MGKRMLKLGLLAAGALALLPAVASADFVVVTPGPIPGPGSPLGAGGNAYAISQFLGTNSMDPTETYSAFVYSADYTSGATYNAYATALGVTGSGDGIFAYEINLTAISPVTDALEIFDVHGANIVAATEITNPSDLSGGVSASAMVLDPNEAEYSFGSVGGLGLSDPNSEILLFAASNPYAPTLKPASLQDDSSNSNQVISDGPSGSPGLPFAPLPSTAWTGGGLLGLLGCALLRRRSKRLTA